MVDQTLWRSIFGLAPKGIFVIIDPRLKESYGQLRALPLLRRVGLEAYTFTSSWRGLDIVPYRYRVINEKTSANELLEDFPLAQFIAQSIADLTTSDASRKLLMAQRSYGANPLLVYVLDSEKFQLPGSLGTKSFIDEYELTRIYGYESIFTRFCQHVGHPPPAIGADKSLNLMLHHLAWTVSDQTLLTRLADLFDYSRIPASSWAWDLLKQLASHRDIRKDDRVVSKLLHSWIDSDITRVSSRLLSTLQQFKFDVELIEKERRRIAEPGDAL
jgi:hypothetical protein